MADSPNQLAESSLSSGTASEACPTCGKQFAIMDYCFFKGFAKLGGANRCIYDCGSASPDKVLSIGSLSKDYCVGHILNYP